VLLFPTNRLKVMIYVKYPLSLGNAEELLAERGDIYKERRTLALAELRSVMGEGQVGLGLTAPERRAETGCHWPDRALVAAPAAF